MKEETITGRIDRNITDLLVHMSIIECIEKLTHIRNNFSGKVSTVTSSTVRDKYIKIYVNHTEHRINQLKRFHHKQEFTLQLFKEKLSSSRHIPNTYSQKYKLLAISES